MTLYMYQYNVMTLYKLNDIVIVVPRRLPGVSILARTRLIGSKPRAPLYVSLIKFDSNDIILTLELSSILSIFSE